MSDLIITASQASSTFFNSDLGKTAIDLAFQATQPSTPVREGPRLEELQMVRAVEGTSIPRLYGRMRLGGQLLWASKVRENVHQTGGGKGSGGAPKRRTYSYNLSFAIGICEGPITRIGRIWADGVPQDIGRLRYRLHTGTETQMPDSTIEAHVGAGNAPAYRGLAYLVFENFDLTAFGNRIPQFNFEVFAKTDESPNLIKAVNIIPAATEFGYDPQPVIQIIGRGRAALENTHASPVQSDWRVSMDDLQETCPSCDWAALVVTWFGTDLRASHCYVRPQVISHEKRTSPEVWSVAGLTRRTASAVSQYNGYPAYGGTPSDETIIRAIKDLKRRGLKVLFYPFVMMDVPQNNRLPNPAGGTGQPAYAWRGRITCYPQSIDGTIAAAAQMARFFNGSGTSSNPRWGLGHMIKHYAELCAKAGGVEAFLVGSELVGLSRVRSARGFYPFAQHLRALARDVRQYLPSTEISYAADWTEYGAHYVANVNDVDFPLDSFWGDANVDFVGIDNYLPLSDWRDGSSHADYRAGHKDIHDQTYLKSNIEGGEYYDWYYANQAARKAQTRTPITDGLGKPWIWRRKDLKNWWRNRHYVRRNGVEGSATSWRAQSKPIWFTEIGCPAVDKGTNEPNKFPDPKSVESGIPFASNGQRDDDIQRQYIRALTDYWSDRSKNPISTIYRKPMIAADRLFVWAWDARPYPAFPFATQIWIDGHSWARGHWINGRFASAPISSLIDILSDTQVKIAPNSGSIDVLDGYVINRIMPPRDALEPLLRAFALEPIAGETGIELYHRSQLSRAIIDAEEHIVSDALPSPQETRTEETELAVAVKLSYIDSSNEYQPAQVEARRPHGGTHVLRITLPMALRTQQAQAIAERLLAEIWIGREKLQFNLPPSMAYLDPGDVVRLGERDFRLTRITDIGAREAEAERFEANLYTSRAQIEELGSFEPKPVTAVPEIYLADLPALSATPNGAPHIGAYASPWQSGVRVEAINGDWSLSLTQPAIMGVTKAVLPAGPIGRWDYASILDVEIFGGELTSLLDDDVLAGGNRLAVETPRGWEVLQFANARLTAPRRYRLSKLLRGQMGTNFVMVSRLAANAKILLLNTAVQPLPLDANALGAQLRLRHGPTHQSISEYGWQTSTFTPQRIALKPFSPVHLKLKKQSNGDWQFTWIRRSRIGGDDWSLPEIPLGETEEIYILYFYRSARLIRQEEVRATNYTYTAAQLRTDNAGNQGMVLGVAQIGAGRRPGYEAKIVMPAS